jgi:predicted phosphodiesterase
MRLAVLSDIHSNADALQAVMTDIATQSPDLTVNLGDCLSGPLQADRTADLLIAAEWPTVRGNHDRWLTDPPDPDPQWDADARPLLSPAHLDWLRTLPATLTIGDAFLCHATPQDDVTRWLNHVTPQGHVAPNPLADIAARAQGIPQSLLLCGHSHVAEAVRLPDGRLIVNPGSVGVPGFVDAGASQGIVTGAPHARYAILDRTPHGWSVAFRMIPYDTAPAVALARARGRPDWAEVLETGWIA